MGDEKNSVLRAHEYYESPSKFQSPRICAPLSYIFYVCEFFLDFRGCVAEDSVHRIPQERNPRS
jgi:hypothetical protein